MNKIAKRQLKTDIMEAYTFLRENNYTIPDQSLDFIKNAALEKLDAPNNELKMLKHLQERLEMLINLTPTGAKRNKLTKENIKALLLIKNMKGWNTLKMKKQYKYIKDKNFDGLFKSGNLVREVGTDRVFIFNNECSACNYNSTFERVFKN